MPPEVARKLSSSSQMKFIPKKIWFSVLTHISSWLSGWFTGRRAFRRRRGRRGFHFVYIVQFHCFELHNMAIWFLWDHSQMVFQPCPWLGEKVLLSRIYWSFKLVIENRNSLVYIFVTSTSGAFELTLCMANNQVVRFRVLIFLAPRSYRSFKWFPSFLVRSSAKSSPLIRGCYYNH